MIYADSDCGDACGRIFVILGITPAVRVYGRDFGRGVAVAPDSGAK
jgi:hypothetical protein